MNKTRPHTTIGLKKTTKQGLDKRRAPGQCYDGFLCQLMDAWDELGVSKRIYFKKQVETDHLSG